MKIISGYCPRCRPIGPGPVTRVTHIYPPKDAEKTAVAFRKLLKKT